MSRIAARATRPLLVVTLGALIASCKLFGGEDPSSITLSVVDAAPIMLQGEQKQIVITIERKNFDKPIALAIDGTLPSGITATFTPSSVPNGTGTATLRITAAPTAVPTALATVVIKATGEGIPDFNLVLDLTVNVRGSHTLGLLGSTLSVAQGGGGSATVLVNRTNQNTGNVTLTVAGAPPGVTATFGQSPTTETATSLNIAAASSVATGSYNLTVAGTQPGVAEQQVTLTLNVIAPPPTTNVSLPFCANGMPTWFAFQNQGFAWQQLAPTGSSFNFAATDRFAIAFVFQTQSGARVNLWYTTRAEVVGLSDLDCPGAKTLSGSMTLAEGQVGIVAMGNARVIQAQTTITLTGVAPRPLDLIAVRGGLTQDGVFSPDRMIVRRALDLPTNSAIPQLDFAAAESFVPSSSTLTISGASAGEQLYVQNDFWGSTFSYGPMFSARPTGSTVQFSAVPSAQLTSADLHQLYVEGSSSATVGRASLAYFGAPSDRTETLGPAMSIPTTSAAARAPYLRMRGQLSAQTDYPTAVQYLYSQPPGNLDRRVNIFATAAHFGGLPATWDVTIPDFTGTTGFNPGWMLTAGSATGFSVAAYSARPDLLFGTVPVSGDVIKFGFNDQVASTVQLLRGSAFPRERARAAGALARPQYFRR